MPDVRSAQVVGREPILGDVLGRALIHRRFDVERDEACRGQRGADCVDHVGDLVRDVGVHQRDDVRRQEEALGVFERHQLVGLDARIGAVDVRDLDVAGHQFVDRRVGGRIERDRYAVDLFKARRSVGALFELRRAAEDEAVDAREVGDRREPVLLGERGRYVVGVLIGGGRLVEDRQPVGQGIREGRIDVLRCGRGRVGLEVLQQVAGVLGEQVDRAVLE